MKHTITRLQHWPTFKNKQPIFNSTNEALLYAQLIYDKPDEQAKLQFYRDDCYIKLKYAREKNEPNLDYMFLLAVRAQLFRECLEECQRISDERQELPPAKSTLKPGERYDNTNHI